MALRAEEFLQFARPHWKRLHVVAHRYVTGSEDAHDLVQETLLRAWRSFSPGEERSYRRAWLFVIMRSVVIDWQRASGRRVKLVPTPDSELTEFAPADLTEPFAPLPTMDEARFREFLDDRIVAALDALDSSFREALILSVAGGLTYREVAEVLDCPVGTVMSRVARARRELRENLTTYAKRTGWVRENRS